jgi:hypothetical protein
MYLEKVKARLEELHLAQLDKIIPCTEEEVRTLEQEVGLSLPAAYREFLLWMGHGTDGLLRGSDCLYEDLILLQRDAVGLMKEDDYPEPLPEDAFVFLMHQGYQFGFFRTSEGDDPPVYRYYEGADQSSITTIGPHFSEHLLSVVEDTAKIIENTANRRSAQAKNNPDFAE